MDFGNSGSIQSSSGGDEDYDSRAADDSSFNNPSSTTTTTNPLLFSHSFTMFDPLSNYFNPPILTQLQSNQTNQTLMNTNMPTWSKPQPNPFFTPMSYTQHSQTIGGGGTTTTTTSTATTTATTSGNNNQDQSAVVSGARNPKKRSRASRRAPTTVLTTDTLNFRAMVQEFTGIPSPPFTSSSSPFPRTRLDLFTSPTTLSTSSFRSPPSTFHHNLIRPFPHKIQPQLSTFTNNNNHNINTISTAAATSTTSPSAILKQPPQRSCNDNYILNNMQIQNLAFESFLPQPSSNDDQDFGILPSHTQVNTNLLRNISNKNNSESDLK